MKIKKLMMTACCVAAAMLSVTSVQALTSIQVREIKQTVLSVPVPEMPAKAAELVANAKVKDRQAVAVTAVRAVVAKHRAAAPLVVAAISKIAPEVAPAVAVAAAEIVNDQASVIAHAAAVAAPTHAPQISTVVAKAVPDQSASVFTALAPVISRGSASGGSGYRTDDNPINQNSGGNGLGSFNNLPDPNKPTGSTVIYNTPRTE